MRFTKYDPAGFFDEMFGEPQRPRPAARALVQFINRLPEGELLRRQRSAERALLNMGITFNVYGDSAGTERIFPFDLVPRIVAAAEWRRIERGLKQRIHALNLFIDDVYHEQKIVKDGVDSGGGHPLGDRLPAAVRRAEPAARHLVPHHRHRPGARRRRQDLRARRQPALPVGRVLRAREPRGDEAHLPAGVRGVADPPGATTTRAGCCDMLRVPGAADVESPRVVVLTPGIYNSAYFEHSLPGAADGRRARRRARPRRRRRLRLHADDARASSGST